jgi:long-chain acyl-CoA synthetase
MRVQDFLENSAQRLPQKVALVCDGQRLTYAEIDAQADRLANALRASGLKRGDRAVICLPNSVPLAVSIFGVLKADGVFVVVNHTTKPKKLAYILDNCEAAALIAPGELLDAVWGSLTGTPPLRAAVVTAPPLSEIESIHVLSYDAIQANSPVQRPSPTNIGKDLACLIYTSGSTGEPKGVMSDHSNVDFATSSIISYLGNNEDDVVLDVLPLSFDYGLYQLLMTFKFGGTLVLERSFAFPATVLTQVERERVTGFPGVPTMFAILLRMDLTPFDLKSLRYLTNTAAALPASHIRELRAKFPWATLYSMYGLTETKRTLYMPPAQLDSRPGSVGIAIPGTEVWLEDDEGRRLGPNQIGELVVRGQHVMRGYWGDHAATAARFRPGPIPGESVCHTGDLFKMDEEGYFYFVARRDDIIKTRGEKVAPKEVEAVLLEMEGVVEAAVVGVADAILGEAVKAYVVVDAVELSQSDVIRYCREHLEELMVPKQVEFCRELPKTPSGKIAKAALK